MNRVSQALRLFSFFQKWECICADSGQKVRGCPVGEASSYSVGPRRVEQLAASPRRLISVQYKEDPSLHQIGPPACSSELPCLGRPSQHGTDVRCAKDFS